MRVVVELALFAAALITGAAWGRSCAPQPEPRVEIVERVVEKLVERKAEAVERVEGPVRIVTRWRVAPASPLEERQPSPAAATDACRPAPAVSDREGLLVERIEERGPVTENRRTETARAATIEASSVLQVVPPAPSPRPGWAISGGLQLLPDRAPVVGIGRRLLGPVWLEAQLAQRLAIEPPRAAVLVRVEF